MFNFIKSFILFLIIVSTTVFSWSQQSPRGAVFIDPGYGRLNLRLDDNPDNDISFLSLNPAIGVSSPVFNRVHAYASFRYISLSGSLLDPYEGSVATVGARYYLNVFDSTRQTDNYALNIIKKRFSIFIDASYGKKIHEKLPENNRYKSIGDDWTAGVGIQFYFTPWLSISRIFSYGKHGPFYGEEYGLVRSQFLSVHKRLEYWPKNQSLWSLLKDKRNHKGKKFYGMTKGSSQLEIGYGYAPDRVLDDNTGDVIDREHPMFYRIGVRYAPIERLDVGGSIQLIDAIGSIPELSDRRDQYYALIASGQYTVMPLKGRFKPVVKAHLKYSNYTYYYDRGHEREGRFYAGFAPSLRFFASHRVLVNASMNFFFTTDNDRNTLANNYPELSVSLLRGGK